jgi:MFS family permease
MEHFIKWERIIIMALKLPVGAALRRSRGRRDGNARQGSGPWWAASLQRLLPATPARDERVIVQHIREGRFQRSLSAITAFASLLSGLEATYEHYIGSYSQRIMYTPVFISLGLTITAIWGAFSRRVARVVLPVVSLITVIDGVVGFIMHVRGVHRKPGGWRIPVFNIVMGPPLLAPLLFATSGFLGLIAAFLRREEDLGLPRARLPRRSLWLDVLPQEITKDISAAEQDIREGRFQRTMAIATAIAAFFSGFESLYSHYKNNFTYRIEWTPILLTPAIIVAGIGAIWSRTIARTLLPITSALALINGGIGFFYHVRGVMRRPGGLKLPFYNIFYGPPIFAPLLFAATGFLGLLASLLRREK